MDGMVKVQDKLRQGVLCPHLGPWETPVPPFSKHALRVLPSMPRAVPSSTVGIASYCHTLDFRAMP